MNKILAILISLLALAGCSASGPIYSDTKKPDNGNATIVIYRTPGLAGKAHVHRYFIDHKWVGSLRTGGYTSLEVKAGNPLLFGMDQTTGEIDGFSFIPKAGETYYVRDAMETNSANSQSLGNGLRTLSVSMSSFYGVVAINQPPSEVKQCLFNPPYTKLSLEGF